jgi:hypothetical protein
MQISAILTNWSLSEGRLHGQIVTDYTDRFDTKEYITTSPVERIYTASLNGNGVCFAKTKNSTYILVG